MKFTPIIALVDDDTLARLTPLVAELTALWAVKDQPVAWQRAMLLNGWSPEMIAWGLVLAAAGREDLEIVRGPQEPPTPAQAAPGAPHAPDPAHTPQEHP